LTRSVTIDMLPPFVACGRYAVVTFPDHTLERLSLSNIRVKYGIGFGNSVQPRPMSRPPNPSVQSSLGKIERDEAA